METYKEFLQLIKRAGIVGSIGEVLGWDQEVMMPPNAITIRAQEKGVLASVGHELATNPRIGVLLKELEGHASLDEEQQAQVREVAFDYARATKVPNELVQELSEASTHAVEVWKEAREKNDFALFAPHLKKLIELHKKYAHAIDSSKHPYDVLVEDYESDLSVEEMQKHFDAIKARLVPLLKEVTSRRKTDTSILQTDLSADEQHAFNTELAKYIGYDFTKGRLDKSVHPFTSCYGRITTRYGKDFFTAMSATLHEGGHAFYEHGLSVKHFGTPLGESRSLSVHESQSRLWENHVGKSREFWKGIFPKIQERFGVSDFEAFYKAINAVEAGFIRVDADELTYTMHVILRFELERGLIEGTIAVDDVPRLWNEKMQAYLGITPPTDTLGCLQDTHWASGLFGYFPTYSMGSMIAAQLFHAIEKDISDIHEQIEKGSFDALHNWLTAKIHVHGRLYGTKELIRRATGEEPNPNAYLDYLEKKYR